MGACGSRLILKKKKKNNNNNLKRRKAISRHVSSRKLDKSLTFQGSVDGTWFDSCSVFESEFDEDFHSVHDDFLSLNSLEKESGDNLNQRDQNVEKKRLSCSGTPRSRRKTLSKLSFKLREGYCNPALVSPRVLSQKPIAGSSISCCPIEKKMPDSWSPIGPNTFKVRGQNYFRDKKKDFAPNCAAFLPFGADVFLSPRKIDHIARFVELPVMDSSEEIPSILVVNIQIPLYPAAVFQSENDGEGMSLVLYFKLSENYSKELPLHFQENIIKIINDEVKRVRSFPLDTIAPCRERLKMLGRVTNMEDLQLSTAEKKILNAYSEKPVLSRPQHEFYLGGNYLEIDIDMHRFSYISRKGFEAFQDRFKLCILDFGLTIQENKAENLPENMLCCIRLNKIDYSNYRQLGL